MSLRCVFEQDTSIQDWFNPGSPVLTLLKIVDWDIKNQIKQTKICGVKLYDINIYKCKKLLLVTCSFSPVSAM